MNSQWKIFLESHGATVSSDGQVTLATSEPAPDCALCDLSHLGLIRVSGEDAADFLQGLLINDIRDLTPEHAQLSGTCNPKGRLFANFWIFHRGEEIFLQLPGELVTPLLKRLSMFLLRARATLVDVSDELVRIGIAGDCANALLEKRFPAVPAEPCDTRHHQGMTLIRLPGVPARYEVIGEATDVGALWERLATDATPAGSDYWPLLDIHAGIPVIHTETVETFIPQMVNMQLIGGVSFSKGCYIGQEVVARTQHRGTLKRRMYLAHISGNQRPNPGAELFSPSAEHGQSAGIIVDASALAEGGYDALAMVQIPCFEADNVHLGDKNGPKLEFRNLPYAFQ